MPEDTRSVECGECGNPLSEPTDADPSLRAPCPKCGSLRRNFHVAISETLTIHEKLGIKVRGPAGGRPRYEAVGGDDLHRKSGIWMNLTRIIDRLNNRYEETVTNPQTGEVVHQTVEPLSQHKHPLPNPSPGSHKGDDA